MSWVGDVLHAIIPGVCLQTDRSTYKQRNVMGSDQKVKDSNFEIILIIVGGAVTCGKETPQM